MEYKITVSSGIFYCDNIKQNINSSIEKADAALYISKIQEKIGVQFGI
ncbi:hypothetical protein PL321_10170 [Caloramator sp. mosi_1]|nr:hypothetical protein [Caloramator sp. mosi_1]WDC83185.1 hypothetical protein PL321_10170 [Caloramator sp. mosi_1]